MARVRGLPCKALLPSFSRHVSARAVPAGKRFAISLPSARVPRHIARVLWRSLKEKLIALVLAGNGSTGRDVPLPVPRSGRAQIFLLDGPLQLGFWWPLRRHHGPCTGRPKAHRNSWAGGIAGYDAPFSPNVGSWVPFAEQICGL